MARKQLMAEQIIIKLREAEVGLAFGAGGKLPRPRVLSLGVDFKGSQV